jgi:NADH:ubiquinone oxidoreductase subunit 6 (subunit J)
MIPAALLYITLAGFFFLLAADFLAAAMIFCEHIG